MDALLPGSKDPAKLKFRTLFNGLTIGPLLKKGTSQCDRTISGTDALTGFDLTTDIKSFFGAHAYPILHHYIEHTALISGAAINDDVTSLVDPHITTTTPDSILSSVPGAKDLKFTQLTRNSAVGAGSILPQCFFTLEAPGAATRYEPEEYYVSFRFQLPDLNTILTVPSGGGHWWAFFDYKHDGYLSQQYGDYRLISQIIKGADGVLYWNTRADNQANGGGVVPSVGPGLIKYWESNVTTGVDLETPLLFECYVRRPQKIWVRSSTTESGASGPKYRKDLVTGITKMGVTNLSTGVFTTLANQIGGEQMGNENLVLGRAFHGFYSATANNVSYLTDLQFWDSIPAHSSLSKRYTYNRAKFYAPLRGSLALTKGTGSATFTRATAAWEFNELGKLYKVPSGAVRMRGYRPVVNWFADPDNISGSASWAVSNVSKASATGPDGAASDGCLITCTSNTSNNIRQLYTSGNLGGNTRTYRFLYKPGTAGWLRVIYYGGSTDRVSLWFNATTNTIGTVSTSGSGWEIGSYALTASVVYPGWYEIYMVATTPNAGTHYMQMGFVDANNSTNTTAVNGLTLTIAHPMLEDSTGQSDKTPSEYVYGDNGAGANGVKYYATYKNGTDIADADYRGVGLNPNQIINTLLWCRDLTNAAWVKTGITPTLNQTGLDDQSNSCSLLTATTTDGTALQTITAAAAAACSGFYVKRSVGSGSIYFTRDGGTNWTDITSLINNSTFTFVKIENTSVTNPQVGFKIATSGDAIVVDAGINHLGTKIASCPILTTSASVTVNAETLTYPTTYNIETSQGTILATFTADSYSSGMGNIVGSSTAGLATSSSYTCQAKDGTNTVNGSAASPSGTIKIGMAWNASLGTMQAIGENGIETNGTYDGSLGLSTIAILPSVDGYIKDVACFNIVLANSEVQSVFNS